MRRLGIFLAYVLLVTPLGLLSRLAYDPLSRRLSRRATSYWIFPARP
jgi:hypothetical protein